MNKIEKKLHRRFMGLSLKKAGTEKEDKLNCLMEFRVILADIRKDAEAATSPENEYLNTMIWDIDELLEQCFKIILKML
jgi:hypothetical protein